MQTGSRTLRFVVYRTAEGMIDDLSSLIVKPDRFDGDAIYFEADMVIDKFIHHLEILGIDPTCLFSY